MWGVVCILVALVTFLAIAVLYATTPTKRPNRDDVIGHTVDDVLFRTETRRILEEEVEFSDYIFVLSSGIGVEVGYSQLEVRERSDGFEPDRDPELSDLRGSEITDVWYVRSSSGRVCLFFSDGRLAVLIGSHRGNVLVHGWATQRYVLYGTGYLESSPPRIRGYFDRAPRDLSSLPP